MTVEEKIDLVDLPDNALSSSAEWRREKAEEYPEDAERNLSAARELDELAARIRKLYGSPLHKRYHDAFEKHLSRFTDIEQEMVRSIGFRASYSGEEFLEAIIDEATMFDEDDSLDAE